MWGLARNWCFQDFQLQFVFSVQIYRGVHYPVISDPKIKTKSKRGGFMVCRVPLHQAGMARIGLTLRATLPQDNVQ